MLSKILRKKPKESSSLEEKEAREFFEEIEKKQKDISVERQKIKEEHERGARITNHRFTV